MSRFDALAVAAGGLSESFGSFGQSAIYDPVVGPSVSLQAIIEPEEQEVRTVDGIRVVMRTRRATITKDPDSFYGGVEKANEAATMTFNGEEWGVESTPSTASTWILMLVRPEIAEQARPGYRGQT